VFSKTTPSFAALSEQKNSSCDSSLNRSSFGQFRSSLLARPSLAASVVDPNQRSSIPPRDTPQA
jgi:hypothetical protein